MAHCTTQRISGGCGAYPRCEPSTWQLETRNCIGNDPEDDGKVRKVEVKYKNPKPGDAVEKYQGRGYVTVQRPVHRLIVLVPADNKSEESNPVKNGHMLNLEQ